jgi:hypothetical protein
MPVTRARRPAGDCAVCGHPLREHVEAKACVEAVSLDPPPRRLADLPIFGRVWADDGYDLRA